MPRNEYRVSIGPNDVAENKPFTEVLKDAALRSMIQNEARKIYVDNDLTVRDQFAKEIMAGICAGDWKLDTSNKTWDQMAAKRAYEIADAMMKEREISNV
jgi:predicted GNAT family acetyltransferase